MNLKRYKFLHWVYNLIHYRELGHNRQAYRANRIRKGLVASLSSRNFPDTESRAWLDQGNSRLLAPGSTVFQQFPPAVQEQLLSWSDKGYMILKQFLNPDRLDEINGAIEDLVRKKQIRPTHDNKLMFANHRSGLIREITQTPSLMAILTFILGKTVVPFQTINFLHGSNQRAHSDSIHMTTYPLGYLIAVWIALEDISPDSGPLFYYPGSHRLPYLLNKDFNEGENSLLLGKKEYRDYEDRIAEVINQQHLEPEVFLAQKGDVFIWHANLIHGGLPVIDPTLTRKSMVIHYFANDVIKYHEITERPALIKSSNT